MKQPQMKELSEAFTKAQQLLRIEPPPADLENQLLTLEQQIRPDERQYFGDLWSSFMLLSDPIHPDDEK
jgi:hypothetical protein